MNAVVAVPSICGEQLHLRICLASCKLCGMCSTLHYNQQIRKPYDGKNCKSKGMVKKH